MGGGEPWVHGGGTHTAPVLVGAVHWTHTHAHIHTTLSGGGLAMPSCDRDLHCAHSTAPTPSCAPLPCRCIYISHQPPLFSLTLIPPFTHVVLVCPTNEAARTTADHAKIQYPTCRRRSASQTHCHMGTHTYTHSKCASRVRVRASVRLLNPNLTPI